MIKRIEYAVKIRGTAYYFVRSQRRDGRGGSHLEPMDMENPDSWPMPYRSGMQVRTWAEKRAAKNFIYSWQTIGKTYGDCDGDVWFKEVPERKLLELEIVEVEILLP